jgi:hypothetical protein
MKCHEFMNTAECLTPLQLSQMQNGDAAMSAHARECVACRHWLESQTLLGNAMHALRASTARREAGPNVEIAVLTAFRNREFAPEARALPGRAAPVVWKLSRAFEFGAYAAVAAALILAVFLGSRLWHDRQAATIQAQSGASSHPVRSAAAPAVAVRTPEISNVDSVGKTLHARTDFVRAKTVRGVTGPAEATDNEGFVALMLCDPLICSGDEQVVRMELPGGVGTSAASGSGQPVIADIVIGDDGLVRAMRIVN